MNKLVEKVKSYIEANELLGAGDTVLVGLSGGADSVCLLMILSALSKEMGIKLSAVHVHHGIRGEMADADEEFAKELCDRFHIPFISYHKDVIAVSRESNESLEECGRRLRYEIFTEEAKKYPSCKIAVAHHMVDQAETVIFRMLRGTGVKGIAGMKPQNGMIIRPLLCLNREEILGYLSDNNQEYRIDLTNEEITYSRNYIRKEILPRFQSINGKSIDHICQLSEDALEVMQYIEEETENVLTDALYAGENHGIKKFRTKVLNEAKPVIKTAAIRQIIESEGISLKDVSREHISQIEKILLNTRYGKVNLPGGVNVICESGLVYIASQSIEDNEIDWCQILKDGDSCIIPGQGVIKCRVINDFSVNSIPDSLYTKWFDYDKIEGDLWVRNRKAGDYLIVDQKGMKKTLKDYMINEKIPKSQRERIPLIACKEKICWVVGYRISADVKVTENTKRVLEIVFEKEKNHG